MQLCKLFVSLLFIRLINVKSTGEIVVIGLLTLFAGIMCVFLIFEKHIKQSNFSLKYKKYCGENKIVMYYMTTITLLLMLEIFFLFIPFESEVYKTLKLVLMSFFLIGICTLSILIYLERKKRRRLYKTTENNGVTS